MFIAKSYCHKIKYTYTCITCKIGGVVSANVHKNTKLLLFENKQARRVQPRPGGGMQEVQLPEFIVNAAESSSEFEAELTTPLQIAAKNPARVPKMTLSGCKVCSLPAKQTFEGE